MTTLRGILTSIVTTLITLFGVAVIVFVVIRIAPGDPISMMLPPGATQADIDRIFAIAPTQPRHFEARGTIHSLRRDHTAALNEFSAGLGLDPKHPLLLINRAATYLDERNIAAAMADYDKLIDQAGCRGLRIGGAKVSEMHCNFLINDRAATAEDIERLGETVRARVKAITGTTLHWEIIRLGVPRPGRPTGEALVETLSP